MKLLTGTNLVIKETHDHRFRVFVTDEASCIAIKQEKVKLKEVVVAFGKAGEINNDMAKMFLDPPKIIKDIVTLKTSPSYKCFCSDNIQLATMVSHPTPISSWDCLMARLGMPKYIIITQESTKNEK